MKKLILCALSCAAMFIVNCGAVPLFHVLKPGMLGAGNIAIEGTFSKDIEEQGVSVSFMGFSYAVHTDSECESENPLSGQVFAQGQQQYVTLDFSTSNTITIGMDDETLAALVAGASPALQSYNFTGCIQITALTLIPDSGGVLINPELFSQQPITCTDSSTCSDSGPLINSSFDVTFT